MAQYVVFDLEPPHRKPQQAEIVEIAAVACALDGQLVQRAVFKRLAMPEVNHAEAVAIHGLTDEKLAGQDTPQMAVDAFVQWLDAETDNRTIVVGHHILGYDLPVLRRYTPRLEGMRALDTLPLVREIYPFLKNFKLTTVYDKLRGKPVTAHRALADVNMCIHVLECAQTRLESAGLGLSVYVKPT